MFSTIRRVESHAEKEDCTKRRGSLDVSSAHPGWYPMFTTVQTCCAELVWLPDTEYEVDIQTKFCSVFSYAAPRESPKYEPYQR